MFNRRTAFLAMLLGMAVVIPAGAASPAPTGFRIVPFDLAIAGATSYDVRGINASGTVVGTWVDAQNKHHGYIRTSAGAVTPVDLPGAAETFLTGINDGGAISAYTLDSAGNATAYLRKADGSLSARTISGAQSISTTGINTAGQVLGNYQGAGVLFSPAGADTVSAALITVPLDWAGSRGVSTEAFGVNDSNQVVGRYCAMELSGCVYAAFLRDSNNKFVKLNDSPSGINADGQMSIPAGVVDISGNRSYVSLTGAAGTTTTAIANGGGIAGTYTTTSNNVTTMHGFTATPCSVSIDVSSANFNANANGGQIQVLTSADCSWSAVAPQGSFAFIAANPTGTGPGLVTFGVPANTQTSSPRTTTLNIGGKVFTITQAGAACTITLGANSAPAGAGGGTGSVAVTAPVSCSWTATSNDPSWLLITSTTGTGVNYLALPNSASSTRSGTITIGDRVFTVNQAGGSACAVTAVSASGTLPGAGGSATINVTAGNGCAWAGSTSAGWLTLASAYGVGPGSFQVTAGANTTGVVRTTLVIVGGVSASVSQAASEGCSFRVDPLSSTIAATGGSLVINVTPSPTSCTFTATSNASWLTIASSTANSVSVNVSVGTQARTGTLTIAGQTVQVNQLAPNTSCAVTFGNAAPIDAAGGTGTVTLNIGDGCPWQASTSVSWLAVSPARGTGPATLTYNAQPNPSIAARSGNIVSGGVTAAVAQNARLNCTVSATPSGVTAASAAGTTAVTISTDAGCAWSANSLASWITFSGASTGNGNGTLTLSLSANSGAARFGTVTIGDVTLGVTQSSATQATGTRFVPVTPCRIADTRYGQGKTGAFGPGFIGASQSRDIPIPLSSCGIPGTALAYSLNVTVVPYLPLGYLTVWPTAQSRPFTSNLNSPNATVAANAAIVPAGAGGSVSLFASDATEAIVDINGYFVGSDSTTALAFYPVTPCRVLDTRAATGTFGGPTMPTGGSKRTVPVPQSTCGIPANAAAYSVNFTVVPTGRLSYLTTWPTGQSQPFVSTLNSWDGTVLANAAIVPAGTGGAIDFFTLNENGSTSDVILDINGYFALPAQGGLSFYPVTPCRVVDTRASQGKTGAFGPPALGSVSRDFPVPASGCNVPSTAQAYALNATVVPTAFLGYLALWPAGKPQPGVSTLNSWDGRIVANAALVPAGTNGAVTAFAATNGTTTDLVLDVFGYFAP